MPWEGSKRRPLSRTRASNAQQAHDKNTYIGVGGGKWKPDERACNFLGVIPSLGFQTLCVLRGGFLHFVIIVQWLRCSHGKRCDKLVLGYCAVPSPNHRSVDFFVFSCRARPQRPQPGARGAATAKGGPNQQGMCHLLIGGCIGMSSSY